MRLGDGTETADYGIWWMDDTVSKPAGLEAVIEAQGKSFYLLLGAGRTYELGAIAEGGNSPIANGITAATNTSRPTGRKARMGPSRIWVRTLSKVFVCQSKDGPDLILWGS